MFHSLISDIHCNLAQVVRLAHLQCESLLFPLPCLSSVSVPRHISKINSWVISGTSVTVESGQRFMHGFVIFEGSFKKLAGMSLAQV